MKADRSHVNKIARITEVDDLMAPFVKEPVSGIAWVSGGNVDESTDLCSTCCQWQHRLLLHRDRLTWRLRGRKGTREEFFCNGGEYVRESDIVASCHCCGVLLTYSLTEYGAAEELNHFFFHRDQGRKINGDEFYELSRILTVATWTRKAELIDEILKLAEWIVPRLPAAV